MTKYSGQSPIGEGITFGGVRYQPNLSSFDSPKKITHPGGSGIPLSGQSSYAHRRRTSPNYGVSKGVSQSILSFYEDHRNWDNLGLFRALSGFLVITWLFAPFLFNPSGFEWQKIVDDWDDFFSFF